MPLTVASITSIDALVVMSIMINLEIKIYLVPNYINKYTNECIYREKLCNKTDNFDPSCRNQIDEVVEEHHAFFGKKKISRTALLLLAIKD